MDDVAIVIGKLIVILNIKGILTDDQVDYILSRGIYKEETDEFSASGDGLEAMMRIMDVVGVDTWEELKGKIVRVKLDGFGKKVDIIGNVMKDKWFNIKEFFEAKEGGEEK